MLLSKLDQQAQLVLQDLEYRLDQLNLPGLAVQ